MDLLPRRRTDANIGARSEAEKFTPLYSQRLRNPCSKLTRGAGSVSVKTQKRCPRIRTGPDHTALKTRLQTDRFSAKKQPQAPAPQKTASPCSSGARRAYFCSPQHAQRKQRDCWSLRGSNHDPRATHPQPAPGRGRRRNAARRSPDATKRRRGARQNDPTSEACVTRRPFQASQRWRSGGV